MDHTLKVVDEELADLIRQVTELGDLAVSQVRAAVEAFFRFDAETASRIVKADEELDRRDGEIERQAVRFIALRQPMADDLRVPITAMKVSMNLERCGDMAKGIAKRTAQMLQPPAKDQASELAALGALVGDQLANVMAAYKAGDANAALKVWSSDTEVDEAHEKVFQGVISCMTADSSSVESCTHMLFITKNLERIGDHATNIAELVTYQVTGQELAGRPKL